MDASVNIRNTVLLAEHEKLNARMVPFAGWNMPVQYEEGILEEHEHTRTKASLFDICHMGEFLIEGTEGTADKLDRIFARPVFNQPVGVCRYNLLLNDRGGIMDDLIVYRRSEHKFFIVVNAGCIGSDAARIQELLPADLKFRNISDETAKLDLQGPESRKVLCQVWNFKEEDLPRYFHFMETEINGVPVLISRTGYTGELGYELYFPAASAVDFWHQFLAHPLVKPAGLGARDTLRLEAGLPLYGHEMNPEITPFETGYGKMLQLDKFPGRVFAGREGMTADPGNLELCALYIDGRRAAREHTEVKDRDGRVIGRVTSGCFAPSLKQAIAFAYLEKELIPQDGMVFLPLGRVSVEGHIGILPFYKNGTVKG